ncbi:MAG TPA: hypothetical protein VEG27_12150 [Usitatibacter sp.]|nr:hypothetical protein [Usitatibacter sp.]
MSDALLGAILFGGVVVGVWLSYRFFMRGNTDAERVASRLPGDFKPEWSWRRGDTYVGYEPASGRLALVDYPHGTVVQAREVQSVEPSDESTLGIVHRWVVVTVPGSATRYRVWFGLSPGKRDSALARLKEIVAAR